MNRTLASQKSASFRTDTMACRSYGAWCDVRVGRDYKHGAPNGAWPVAAAEVMCKVHGLARLKNRWLFALTAGFLLFVAGCSQSDQAAGEKPPQMPPTPVTAVAVKQKDVPLQLHAIGSVGAWMVKLTGVG